MSKGKPRTDGEGRTYATRAAGSPCSEDLGAVGDTAGRLRRDLDAERDEGLLI